jgi:hypothetical protein
MVLSVAVAAIGVVVAFVMIRGQGHSVDEEARMGAEEEAPMGADAAPAA